MRFHRPRGGDHHLRSRPSGAARIRSSGGTMPATDDHARTGRRMLVALAVVVATTFVAAAPAFATGRGAKSKTPVEAYKQFEFEFEISVVTPSEDPAFTLATKGSYVKPNSQDCEVT